MSSILKLGKSKNKIIMYSFTSLTGPAPCYCSLRPIQRHVSDVCKFLINLFLNFQKYAIMLKQSTNYTLQDDPND